MSDFWGNSGKQKKSKSLWGEDPFKYNPTLQTQTVDSMSSMSDPFNNSWSQPQTETNYDYTGSMLGNNKQQNPSTNNSFNNNSFDNRFANTSTATYQPQAKQEKVDQFEYTSSPESKPKPVKQQEVTPVYPTHQINNKYGTYWNQYEDYKKKLQKFPDFSYLAHEDNTPKTDGEIFFPEMTFQTKLEELTSKINKLNWSIMQKSNPAVHNITNNAAPLNNDRIASDKPTGVSHDNTHLSKQPVHEIDLNQSILYQNDKTPQRNNKDNSNTNNEYKDFSGSGYTAAIEENTKSNNNADNMPPEENIDSSKILLKNDKSFSPEISIDAISSDNNSNSVKSLVWINPDNRKVILKGEGAELFALLQVPKPDEEDKRSYPPLTYLDGLTQQLQQNIHSYAKQNGLNPHRFISALHDNKEMLADKYNLSAYSAQAQDNFVLFYTLEEMNSKNDYFINPKTNQISVEDHNKLALIDNQIVASKTKEKVHEIHSKNTNNYITPLRTYLDNVNGAINYQELRNSSINYLTKNSIESKDELEGRLDYYYAYLTNNNNLRKLDEIIDKNPAIFEHYNKNRQNYDEKSKLMLCAIAKCGEETEIRDSIKREHAQILNQGRINYQNNMCLKNLKSLDKLPSEYDSVIEGFRADGVSDNKIISMLNAHGAWNEQTYRVQNLLMEKLEAILLKEDNFYTLDAGLLNIYYNVVNSIGTLPIGDKIFDSSYLDAQRAMNGAAKQADELLGVKGGEFIREYSASALFFVANICSGGTTIPASIGYTVMDSIVKVRTRYNELKEQGVDDETLNGETFEYAMQIAGIEASAALLSFGFADGTIYKYIKNIDIRKSMKDIMMSLLQVFGYESQKHDNETQKADK